MPAIRVKLVDRRIQVDCMNPVRTVSGKLIVILMGSTPSITRVLAIGLSFWMAAVACVVGCMQPVLARSEPSAPQYQSPNRSHQSPNRLQSGLIADMDCCHHESPSAPANDHKRSPHELISCCPLNARVPVAQKLSPAPPASAYENDAIPSIEFRFAFTAFSHPAACAHACWHSGRDTLRKAHVLRI